MPKTNIIIIRFPPNNIWQIFNLVNWDADGAASLSSWEIRFQVDKTQDTTNRRCQKRSQRRRISQLQMAGEVTELRNHKNWVKRNLPTIDIDVDLDSVDYSLQWLPKVKCGRPSIVPFALESKKRKVSSSSHYSQRFHPCQTCEETFVTRKELMAHMSTFDHGFAKYNCTICNGNFTSATFPDHMLTHSCDLCGIRLSAQTHHLTEEKPLEMTCEICGKRYGNKSAYKVHKISHVGRTSTSLVCKDCSDRNRWICPIRVNESTFRRGKVNTVVPDVFVSKRTVLFPKSQ